MFDLYYSNCPVPSAFVVAIRAFEEEFAARGVHFSVLPSEHSTTHFSGDLPAYFRFGGEIPPLITQGLRAPGTTRLIGLTPLSGIQGYFVGKDSDIRTPADLKGRRVGIAYNARHIINKLKDVDYRGLHPWDQTMCALGTWELRSLLHTLALGGLTLADVELVDVRTPWSLSLADAQSATAHSPKHLFRDTASRDGNDQIAAVLDGRCDAIFSFLAYGAGIEQRGELRLIADLGERREDDYVSAFTVSAGLAKDHPEIVQAVMDVCVLAGEWAKTHPDEVCQIMGENLGVSPQSIVRGYGEGFHLDLVPRLDAQVLGLLSQTQQFLVDHALLPAAVDASAWMDRRFLDQALAASNQRATA
ncbi:MAG: 2'-hydroxybiphenyl-2-sulfinate desulfinase [Immundisolibacter sp.]|uniref:2'-hydroxybiphenyl-2-sulfinate desulfinase n=1 Tax=Immundisolibacter sp. TaxID=1934948 RepID=UPI003EDED8F0